LQVRIWIAGGLALTAAVAGTLSQAQEESCVSALESRIKAAEAVMAKMPRPDADCGGLKEKLDAFVAAQATLRKTDRAVRRACPAGEFVRGDDAERSARFQFVVEAVRKRLSSCTDTARQ
jgi:hypothetical protein